MSFDYFVAVHKDKWPTAKAVQAALERLSYPVSLLSAADDTFSISKGKFSLPVLFEGRPVVLEAGIGQASDTNNVESLWGYIAKCASDNFTIAEGDYFLTLTFRTDADQIRAGLYLAAAIIFAF